MDPATLFMIVQINGKDREEHPRQFPSVAACEKHVSDFRGWLARNPTRSSIKSYECMRWYADDTLIRAE
jgi:hypothetical protein